jgi:FMN reductase
MANLQLVAVLGSVTRPGRLRTACVEALARVPEPASTQLIDLAEHSIAFADGTPPGELADDTDAVVGALAQAGAVLIATPIYRGSLTGALKNLLDHLPVEALEGKAVGIVTMGATPHHFLADRHLRDLLAFFGALVVPVTAFLTSADFSDGRPSAPAAEKLDALTAATLLLAHATRGLAIVGPAPLAARRRSGARS